MKRTNEFIKELNAYTNSERAVHEKNYQKSTRKHIGISHGDMEKVIKSFSKDLSEETLVQLATELWQTNVFDYMIASTKILKLKKVQATKKLWSLGKKFLKVIDGWALEVSLSFSMKECLLKSPELLGEVEKWTDHSNFWMRRAALIFTLPFARERRDPERMLKWSSKYASDPEWIIQKAIGWWLRDLAQHNPNRVVKFLNNHWGQLKGVARKEATQKLEKNI